MFRDPMRKYMILATVLAAALAAPIAHASPMLYTSRASFDTALGTLPAGTSYPRSTSIRSPPARSSPAGPGRVVSTSPTISAACKCR